MSLEKKFLVTMEMGFLEKIMSSASVTPVKDGELVLLNPEWDCLRLLLLSIANTDSEKQISA